MGEDRELLWKCELERRLCGSVYLDWATSDRCLQRACLAMATMSSEWT